MPRIALAPDPSPPLYSRVRTEQDRMRCASLSFKALLALFVASAHGAYVLLI